MSYPMKGTMMQFPLTLRPLLERAEKLFPNVEIVSSRPDNSIHRYTYGETSRRARSLAAVLQAAGLERGDRIASLMWNHYVHLEAYFGVPCAGGVLHTLNLRLHPDELAYIINHAQDRFLIVDDALMHLFEQLQNKVKFERVFVVPFSGEPMPAAFENYETLLRDNRSIPVYPDLHEDDAAAMCYTSGTTGKPKGVVYSHRAIALHSYSIWLSVIDTLEHQPERWRLPPGMRVVVAGSAAPESLFRRFEKFGVRVIQPWGMTETTPIATVCTLKPGMEDWPEDQKFEIRAKQGLASPFVEIRGVGDDGEIPWDGKTPGELEIRGPFIAASYYNLPDELSRWTSDGWFRTGDVVTIDAEGYMKITDRTKDLIKSAGEWISSVDVENALVAHPAVKEAAVVAVPHPKWQERPLAAVVLQEGCQVTPEELRSFLTCKFAKWQVPDEFIFVASLPHTSTGKLLKSELRNIFQNWVWSSGAVD